MAEDRSVAATGEEHVSSLMTLIRKELLALLREPQTRAILTFTCLFR
ncbi:hypothetical protein ACNKHU_04535 [Shigella flexneri]